MGNIVLDKVSHTFQRDGKDFLALDNVSFTVADKEFVAVVGPSGCGKTTCLRLAAGLELASTGNVTVGGKRVRSPGPDRAVVFQQFALFPWKTVQENIAFGLRSLRVPREEAAERVARNLKLMGLEAYASAYPHQLSGGMQQRVAIARAYVLNPEVLLMDEPFGALDAQTRTVMQEELLRVGRANPRTVMFITHAVDEAVYLADRVIVMSRRPGTVKEIVAVKPVRDAERWQEYEHIEDVMDLPSFMHLKTHIWRLLREQNETESRPPAAAPRNRTSAPAVAAPPPSAVSCNPLAVSRQHFGETS
jgi:NitT/TauT family transport system ATP-binding protein